MFKSIAILMSGNYRAGTEYKKIIENVKTQFSFFERADIYFFLWKSNEYDDNFIKEIKEMVYFLSCDEEYPLYGDNYKVNNTINVSYMFHNMAFLCDCLKEKYQYVCKNRNDLEIRADFKPLIELLANNITNVIVPYSFWTGMDVVNDMFTIAKHDDFLKIWGRKDIYEMFCETNFTTPERIILIQMLINNLRCTVFMPSYYRKGLVLVENYELIVENLNKYMVYYISAISERLRINYY